MATFRDDAADTLLGDDGNYGENSSNDCTPHRQDKIDEKSSRRFKSAIIVLVALNLFIGTVVVITLLRLFLLPMTSAAVDPRVLPQPDQYIGLPPMRSL